MNKRKTKKHLKLLNKLEDNMLITNTRYDLIHVTSKEIKLIDTEDGTLTKHLEPNYKKVLKEYKRTLVDTNVKSLRSASTMWNMVGLVNKSYYNKEDANKFKSLAKDIKMSYI